MIRRTASIGIVLIASASCFSPPAVDARRRLASGERTSSPFIDDAEIHQGRRSAGPASPTQVEAARVRARSAIHEHHVTLAELWPQFFADAPRGEFETLQAYQARVAEVDPTRVFFFAVPVADAAYSDGVQAQYDIDRGVMNLSIKATHVLVPENKAIGGYGLTIDDETQQTTRAGSTALGVESPYIAASGSEYILSMNDLGDFAGINNLGFEYDRYGRELSLIIPPLHMSAAVAQEAKPHLTVLVGVTFESRAAKAENTIAQTATLQRPIELLIRQKIVRAHLRSLVVYNDDSKEILGLWVSV